MALNLKHHLLQHAIENAWAAPSTDRQYIYAPRRLTRTSGALKFLDYTPFRRLALPSFSDGSRPDRFTVYSLGHVSPLRIGVEMNIDQWTPVKDVISQNGLLFHAFANHQHVDVEGMWIIRLDGNNVLLAVETIPNQAVLSSGYDLWVRFYSSAFIARPEKGVNVPTFSGGMVETTSQRMSLLNQYFNAANQNQVLVLHNGLLKNGVTGSNVEIGDLLQVWVDESILGVLEIDLSNLTEFHVSSLQKYFYVVQNDFSDKAHYYDDAEFYLMGTVQGNTGATLEAGVYLNHIYGGYISNLNHCDYAIDTEYVSNVIDQNDQIDFTDAKLRVYVRRNDEDRQVIGDALYSHQLFQLHKEDRLPYMTGVHSSMPFWAALNQFESPYTELMNENSTDIYARFGPTPDINGVYSHFGALEALEGNPYAGGNTITSVMGTTGQVVLEFDPTTRLLNRVVEDDASMIGDPVSTQTPYALGYPGRLAGEAELTEYDSSADKVDHFDAVRYYRLSPTSPYVPASKGSDYTVDAQGNIAWESHLSGVRIHRKKAQDNLLVEMTLNRTDIADPIDIIASSAIQDVLNSDPDFLEYLPKGRDVWVNGHYLVPGIDCVWDGDEDKEALYIHNLQYLETNSDTFDVTVLLHGTPNYGTTSLEDARVGFVKHGELSRNGTFDFFLDAFTTIYVGGKFTLPEEVSVAETGKGTAAPFIEDGMPYIVLPRVPHANLETVESVTKPRAQTYDDLRQLETAADGTVPQPVNNDTLFINGKHDIVSPLLAKVIEDLDSNNLTVPENLSETQVRIAINPYQEWVDRDLGCQEADEDAYADFIQYQPHALRTTVELNAVEYAFLEQVNNIFLNGRAQLNTAVTIASGD